MDRALTKGERKMKDIFWGLIGFALIFALPAAWLTHIITCLDTERWGFLISGALMFPIAIIHGIMIWLGVA